MAPTSGNSNPFNSIPTLLRLGIRHNDEENITALDARYLEKTTYHDREYQTYSLRHEINLSPTDEEEEDRLSEQNDLLKEIYYFWHNHLHPDFIGEPQSVLDCGYGSGTWAAEMATWDSNCEVIGVDIAPQMEPPDMPENLDLQITNLNDRFTFPNNSFDFVHSRFVGGGIAAAKWPNYLRDIHRVLRRGGWAQIMEWELIFRSANGNTDGLQALQEWSRLYLQSLTTTTRPEGRKSTRIIQDCESWMRMAGFVNVTTDLREIPTCAWPSDPLQRRIGQMNLTNMRKMIRSVGLYPITYRRLRTIPQFEALVNQASVELGRREMKPYLRLYTCWGRK